MNTNKLNWIQFVFLAFVGTTAPFMATNRFSETVVQNNVPFWLFSLKEWIAKDIPGYMYRIQLKCIKLLSTDLENTKVCYVTIIPWAQMDSESRDR